MSKARKSKKRAAGWTNPRAGTADGPASAPAQPAAWAVGTALDRGSTMTTATAGQEWYAGDGGGLPPGPDVPGTRSPRARRRRVLAWAVLAPICFAGGLYGGGLAIRALTGNGSPSTTAVATAPDPLATATAIPRAAVDNAYVPGGATGPGLTAPGILVQALPSANGDLEVVERVRFAVPSDSLTLGVPSSQGIAKGTAPLRARLKDLQVSADGNVVDTTGASLSQTTRLTLPSGTRQVQMRYRLTGSVLRSTPSTPGRALVVLPPLSRGPRVDTLQVIVEVQGGTVRNLQCPALRAADQLCGREGPDRWYTVPLTLGRSAVLAQLDLPSPVGG